MRFLHWERSPWKTETKGEAQTERKSSTIEVMDAYNILNIPAGKVEVGEGPEILREGDAAPLLKVAPGFSDEF